MIIDKRNNRNDGNGTPINFYMYTEMYVYIEIYCRDIYLIFGDSCGMKVATFAEKNT